MLTYHGDDTVINVFDDLQLAIKFAVSEVEDCSDVTPPVYSGNDMSGWVDTSDSNMLCVIPDQDGGTIYTITKIKINPTYQSKYGG